jgi:hypothetical protein
MASAKPPKCVDYDQSGAKSSAGARLQVGERFEGALSLAGGVLLVDTERNRSAVVNSKIS